MLVRRHESGQHTRYSHADTHTRILDTPDESGEPPCLDNGMSHIGMFRRYAAVIDGIYVCWIQWAIKGRLPSGGCQRHYGKFGATRVIEPAAENIVVVIGCKNVEW
jgi:hypothetical protein